MSLIYKASIAWGRDFMPMWAFLLTIVGGLVLFGVIYDQINKRKKRKTPKNLSSSQMVYTENYLNEVRNDISGPQ
ncbi:hypothetical protein B5G50_03545 [Brevibacillus brevis]|nr:hypothetical protein B5G50_03545 [Brevibacillus brevis]